MESGSQSSNRMFPPERDEAIFQTFVSLIPECSQQSSTDIFNCLRLANTSTILAAEASAIASTDEFFPFQPVIDGPNGLIPDIPSQLLAQGRFSKLPFMSGTNKDEGVYISYILNKFQAWISLSGTIFVPTTTNNISQFVEFLESLNLPETQGEGSLERAFAKVLELYPDDPARGSPFGTGNETFGISPVFKRATAILGG